MILVTGGTGLVGAHLLLHLVENEERIRAIYRNPKNIEKTKKLFGIRQKEALWDRIEWVEADIIDIPALELAFQNITLVYHCAALISFDPKDENKLRKTNIEGTANIVNLCLAHEVQKLCYVSSIAALGNLAQNETVISETTDWNPEAFHSDYSITKYGAELEVWRAYQEGLPVVIVNPGIILGSTIWEEGSGALIQSIKKGLPFFTYGQTGYVGVEDVVRIMQLLIESSITGERFCLVAEHLTYKNVLEIIAQKTNGKVPNYYLRPWITQLFWRLDWLVALVFRTKRRLTKDIANSFHAIDTFSNQKIKNTLNYEFQSIDKVLEDILK